MAIERQRFSVKRLYAVRRTHGCDLSCLTRNLESRSTSSIRHTPCLFVPIQALPAGSRVSFVRMPRPELQVVHTATRLNMPRFRGFAFGKGLFGENPLALSVLSSGPWLALVDSAASHIPVWLRSSACTFRSGRCGRLGTLLLRSLSGSG